jgi:N-acyl-phosphatidylethanolamine-hydrolysing phospholipase D
MSIKTSVSSYLFNSITIHKCLAIPVTIFVLTGCALANPYFDPAKPHHTPQGFQNHDLNAAPKSLSDLLRWQYESLQAGLPPAPRTATPTMKADLAFIHANTNANASPALQTTALKVAKTGMQPAITWIGHATMLVQAGGLNVLTDPIFSERAFPVQIAGPKRAQPPGLAVDELPPIDVVLISHNHYDHLDRNSVIALSNRARAATLFIVPLGIKPWMENLGITNVRELDWWDKTVVNGVEFYLTPVQHWSARGMTDRRQTLWGGWAVFAPDLHWYFSGDTGYSQDFADTRAKFADRHTAALGGGFDIALLPIGAYEPRWFMKDQHINPTEAVQIHKDLGAKRSVGVHWGTFALTDEPLDQAPQDLAAARAAQGLQEDDFFVMAVGQTRKLPARQ